MKRAITLLLLCSLLPALGCAVRGNVSKSLVDNQVTFTNADTGRLVTVVVGGDYVHDSFRERSFQDVEVSGDLFKSEDGSSILVSRLTRAEFEKLAGVTLDAATSGVEVYPPRTIYFGGYCQLVRAYVATLGRDVIAAVKVKKFEDQSGECDRMETTDEFVARNIDAVTLFDKQADEAITFQW